jgi:hypothetical protein
VLVQPLVGPFPLFQFLSQLHSGWDSSAERSARRRITQISMPREGVEPATPAFEGSKTVHASDRVATAIGRRWGPF